MGTLASTILPILGQVQSARNTYNNLTADHRRREQLRASQDQAMAALESRQAYAKQQAEIQANEQRAKITLDAAEAEKRRKDALRRSVAKRNATFGARGIASGTGGSREAVLLGLVNESEDNKKAQDNLDRLRFNVIDNDLFALNQRNILERNQLAEQQRVQRLF